MSILLTVSVNYIIGKIIGYTIFIGVPIFLICMFFG